jgi:hypothetical protein
MYHNITASIIYIVTIKHVQVRNKRVLVHGEIILIDKLRVEVCTLKVSVSVPFELK